MATRLKNLSSHNPDSIPSAQGMSFGIVVSDWNPGITHALLREAINTLLQHGATETHIEVRHVPGSFELPLGAQLLAELVCPDAVICLGCVIEGETPHFQYVCQGVTQGIMELNLKYGLPFIFGVLTTQTLEQAQDRAGGKHGNKGVEAAVTAIQMAALRRELEEEEEEEEEEQ